jgi:CBS domain-containing protein
MVDICDEGDLLGLRPLLAQSPYLLKAVASEESLLYAIPTGIFEPVMDDNPRIARYIATSFAVGVGNRYHQSADSFSLSESHLFNHIVSVDGYMKPVFTHADIPVREAAQIMTAKKISSIVICDKGRRPLGIVTDKDLRSKVVAGDILNTAPVSHIMSSPVLCVPPFLTLAEMQMMMLRHRVSHLVVTEDGTDRKIMLGVISKHDLVVVQNDNPAALLKDMQKAQNIHHVKKLRASLDKIIARYVKSDVPMKFILEVTSEINDTLLRKVIELCEKKLDPDYYRQVDYAFIVLGSMARKEQLLMTDQDSAIIYREDDARGQIKEKLLALAREIVHTLHFIGFDYCPAGMMASNPLYCQSLSDWEKTFHKWIHQPGEKEVMMCTIFFDFRAVYGHTDLTERLSKFIFKNLDKQQVFLRHLAQNALANPAPLSFFRKFMVEKSGEHKDTFDIKLRAMMTLVDAARLFILQNQLSGVHSTIERFRKLSETETHHKELFIFAADAFETLLKTRSFHGIENRDSGRYIYPSKMDKMDRIQLRNAFQPIHDIQDIIKVRFVL